MCRRKLSAVIVKSRRSPSRSQAAARTSRRKTVVPRLRRRERAEVVLAREERGRRRERVDVERARPPERTPSLERRAGSAARGRGSDTSASAPRSARGSSSDASSAASDRHVVGKRGVQRLGGALERRPTLDLDARDLARRVHPCVGAARDREPVPAREDRVERVAQRRPRPFAGPAAAPSRGTPCRRTRA